jgi:hypothetical protein
LKQLAKAAGLVHTCWWQGSSTGQHHGIALTPCATNALDANSWFNGYTNATSIPKQALRQNHFGGTLGRFLDIPHLYKDRNRTFFFFSYGGTAPDQPNTFTRFLFQSLQNEYFNEN